MFFFALLLLFELTTTSRSTHRAKTGPSNVYRGDFRSGNLGQISTSDCRNSTRRRNRNGRTRVTREVSSRSVSVRRRRRKARVRAASLVDMVGLTRKMEENAMITRQQRQPQQKNASASTSETTNNERNNRKIIDQSFSSSTTDGRNTSRSKTTTTTTITKEDTTNNSIDTDTIGSSRGGTDAKNSPLDQSLNTSRSNSSLVNEENGTAKFGSFLSTLEDLDLGMRKC